MASTRRQFLQIAGLGVASSALIPRKLLAGPPTGEAPFSVPRGAIVDWHTHWIGPRVSRLLQGRTAGPRLIINEKGERFQVPKGASALREGAKPQDPVWYDVGVRLAHLDKVGVTRQVVGFTGSSYDGVLTPEEASPFWRAQNDDIAELVRNHPTRFLGLATLPTGDVAAAAAELRPRSDRPKSG